MVREIYEQMAEVSSEMNFLSNYCRAYSYLEPIYYFTPYVKLLNDASDSILFSMHNLLFEEEKIVTHNDMLLGSLDDVVFDDW